MDGEDSPDNNMEERVEEFVEFVKEQSQHYLTNHILVTMGEDFQYQAGLNIPPKKKKQDRPVMRLLLYSSIIHQHHSSVSNISIIISIISIISIIKIISIILCHSGVILESS